MCAILINSYDWDSSESEGKRPKPTPLPHMRLWLMICALKKSTILRQKKCSKVTQKVYKSKLVGALFISATFWSLETALERAKIGVFFKA